MEMDGLLVYIRRNTLYNLLPCLCYNCMSVLVFTRKKGNKIHII